ncbi:MAG TPA: DUF1735 domain-containing protein [Fibrella sp.]|jgi:hypothetical protein
MRKYSLLALAGATALFLSSCLKDKNIEDRVYGMRGISDVKLVELPQAPEQTIAMNFFNRDTTFSLLAVRLNSDQPASQDIKVTLVPNPTLVADYNTAHGTNYTVPGSNVYTVDNLTVTIPAGQREGYLKVTTNPANVAQGTYALGFSIGSVSDNSIVLSENYKNLLVFLSVKNKYDGIYSLKGFVTMGGNTPVKEISIPCGHDLEIELATSGISSVTMSHQPAYTSGGPSYFNGLYPIRINFNETTDKVTGVSNLGSLAASFPYVFPDPSAPTYDSRYDPATKTIYMRYRINNSGTWYAIDTLTYCRPR